MHFKLYLLPVDSWLSVYLAVRPSVRLSDGQLDGCDHDTVAELSDTCHMLLPLWWVLLLLLLPVFHVVAWTGAGETSSVPF